jgi:hypothetical protein
MTSKTAAIVLSAKSLFRWSLKAYGLRLAIALFRATASRGIAALTSSSTLFRRAPRAGTRHWTRLRSSDVRRQACSHPPCSRVSAANMRIAGLVLVENKTVEKILPIHLAQLLTYLKLSRLSLGLIINWNVVWLRDGIKRVVRNHPENPGREPI